MSLEVDGEQSHWSVWYSKISMGQDALPLMYHFQGKSSVLSQRTEDEKIFKLPGPVKRGSWMIALHQNIMKWMILEGPRAIQ